MASTLSGVMVVILLVLFVGLAIWAYSPRNKSKFAELAELPLKEERERE